MSIEENKALIRRFVEAVNTGDEATLTQIIADGFTVYNVANIGNPAAARQVDRDTLIKGFVRRLQAVPNFRAIIMDLIAEGDKVVALGRDTGTPAVEYRGIKPNGKSFDVTWVDVYRIRDGQIVEMVVEMNPETARKQLAD
jgi:predicted ester cyclase